MSKKNKKNKKPAQAPRPKISPSIAPVTEPSAYIETRMISKDQLENFLKDVWDDSVRKKWWDHIERVLIAIISIFIPLLIQSILNIISMPTIEKEAFKTAQFLVPLICVGGGLILLVTLWLFRSYRSANQDKKRFITRWLKAFPMTNSAAVPFSSFKPLNPSAAEQEQK